MYDGSSFINQGFDQASQEGEDEEEEEEQEEEGNNDAWGTSEEDDIVSSEQDHTPNVLSEGEVFV